MNLLENRGLNEDTFMLIWESFPKKVELSFEVKFTLQRLLFVVQSCTIQSDQNICWLMPPFPQTLDIFQMSSYWELLHVLYTRESMTSWRPKLFIFIHAEVCRNLLPTQTFRFMILTNQSYTWKEKQATWKKTRHQ